MDEKPLYAWHRKPPCRAASGLSIGRTPARSLSRSLRPPHARLTPPSRRVLVVRDLRRDRGQVAGRHAHALLELSERILQALLAQAGCHVAARPLQHTAQLIDTPPQPA